MAPEPMNVELSFNFILPLGPVLHLAENSVHSDDENLRSVSKAVLDVAREAKKIQSAFEEDRDVDLAPYLDFWFANTIDAANVLLSSTDETTRNLGKCLIEQEKAITNSKAEFLEEMKRRGIRRRTRSIG